MQSENCHETNCFKILFFPRAHINTHWLQRPAVTLKLPLRWPSSMVSQPGERQPRDPTPLFPRKPFPRRVISDFSLTRLRGDLPRSSDIFTLHLHLSRSLADRWCTTGDFTTKFLRSSRLTASAVWYSIQGKSSLWCLPIVFSVCLFVSLFVLFPVGQSWPIQTIVWRARTTSACVFSLKSGLRRPDGVFKSGLHFLVGSHLELAPRLPSGMASQPGERQPRDRTPLSLRAPFQGEWCQWLYPNQTPRGPFQI